MLGRVRRIEEDLVDDRDDAQGRFDRLESTALLASPVRKDASLILPDGRRVRRLVSLSRLSHLDESDEEVDEAAPLLGDRLETARLSLSAYVDDRTIKCTIAYVLASLLVFVPAFSRMLGTGDGKHFAATCVTYFYPARTVGHMLETVRFALTAMLVAVFVSIGSMTTAIVCNVNNLFLLGHMLVLVVWLGGGVALLARWKEVMRNPTVGVATSMSSVIFFTNITREGTAHWEQFKLYSILQYVVIVLIALFISTAVCLAVYPQWAYREVDASLHAAPKQLADCLVLVTRHFLKQQSDPILAEQSSAACQKLDLLLQSQKKSLHEASFELRLAGRTRQLYLTENLCATLVPLSESLSALRSSCEAQHDLLTHPEDDTPTLVRLISQTYLHRLGPIMKSLVYTTRQTLRDMTADGAEIRPSPIQFSNVDRAVALFEHAFAEAVAKTYEHPIFREVDRPAEVADCEEIAASVYYFSAGLLKFVDDLRETMRLYGELAGDHPRSWTAPERPQRAVFAKARRSYSVTLWHWLNGLKRPEIKFALKAGLGAALFALPSMMTSLRPVYVEWRLEWGLLSFYIVLNASVGATYSAAGNRIVGSFLGTVLAVGSWYLSSGSRAGLIVCGAAVASLCMPILLSKTSLKPPFGRFMLLSYNLTALYAYTLSRTGDDRDEGGETPQIWTIALHRTVSVTLGCLWGAFFNAYVAPVKARTSLRHGVSVTLLDLAWRWRGDVFDAPPPTDQQRATAGVSVATLRAYLAQCPSEPRLRGRFPQELFAKLLQHLERLATATRVLDAAIYRAGSLTVEEMRLLQATRSAREELGDALFLYAYLAATAVHMRLSLPARLPTSAQHARDRLLAQVGDWRLARLHTARTAAASRAADDTPASTAGDALSVQEGDYRSCFIYTLITGQLVRELDGLSEVVRELYTCD